MLEEAILSMTDIRKSFGPVQVLHGVDFSVSRGEVRALLGANGAGKSTLMKILGGIIGKNTGTIKLYDQELHLASPLDALEKGIGIIHQELSAVLQLSVLDNFFLGRERTRNGAINRREMIAFYEEICRKMNFDLPHYVKLKDMGIAERQMIEILKTVSYNVDIIVMDEPTSSLGEKEKQNLFNIIEKLKSDGKTIIYITHMLEEVFTVCDSVTVMFGGNMVETLPTTALTPHKIAEMMAGESLSQEQVSHMSCAYYENEPVLSAQNLSRKGHFDQVNFDLYKGEVLGIAGLVGSGRSELVQAIFGADRLSDGKLFLNGKHVHINSPADALKVGIGLIPEDRKNQGLILKHPIYKNATILCLNVMKRFGLLSRANELSYAMRAKEKLSIKLDRMQEPVHNLSGGNQQKVVVSKWLEKELGVLMFDEPTKGIDVHAKEDIFKSIANFTKQGVAVIFISSDLEEVLRVSDRVAILHAGKMTNILKNQELTLQDIMREILV